jgi:hypothetical protein
MEKTPEEIAYDSIATAYPHEAFEQDKQKFCAWVRARGYNMTDEEIETQIKATAT